MISLIVATDRNLLIGKQNALPWKHIPIDMKHFRDITIGKTIVMGRKTFESIGSKPLKNRKNIVITTDTNFQAEGVTIYHSPEEVLRQNSSTLEMCIIGGSTIYKSFLPYIDLIYYTFIDEVFEGDTYLPQDFFDAFALTEERKEEVGEKNPYPLYFKVYKRK